MSHEAIQKRVIRKCYFGLFAIFYCNCKTCGVYHCMIRVFFSVVLYHELLQEVCVVVAGPLHICTFTILINALRTNKKTPKMSYNYKFQYR